MYFQPYGDEQQLNLNWIINEIINLHKQLDPDYETPSFTQVYPYSNLNRLNLDWILSELKALKELAPEPTPTIDIQAVAEALVALPFDSSKSYQIYDFISRDGEIWRATEAIPAGGVWDSTKWFKTKIGTDLAVLDRWINSINNSLTSEIQARQDADTALQNTINALTSADISDDSEAGGANVKASLNALKGSLNAITPQIRSTSPSNTDCAPRTPTVIATLTLTEGTWLLNASHEWGQNVDSDYIDSFFNITDNTQCTIRNLSMRDGGGAIITLILTVTRTVTINYVTIQYSELERPTRRVRFSAIKFL